MNNEQRIKTNKIAIDEDDVKLFFNNRVNKNLPYLINYTNYQDKHPELALERDKYEKDRIMPFLNLQPESRILDIGCGVGRWGNHILKIGGRICIKESVGLHDRLTLNKIYSEELESQYSAIYRGVDEYNILFRDAFSGDKYNIVYQDVMWQGDLANRKETTAYFWIIEKIR